VERQRAHETVENRVIQLRRHDRAQEHGVRGLGDGEPNLLLMVPALGQLARDIEPVRGDRLARPADADARRSERVEKGVR
jgi:hypothetical protein